MLTATKALGNYAGAPSASNATAPRQLGFMERIEGARGGLEALTDKLEAVIGRLAGQGNEKAQGATPHVPGIPGNLNTIEDRIRRLHELVDGLSEAF